MTDILNIKENGVWKGIPAIKGNDGISVTGVTLISTVGLNKTYRMSFSNGTHFDYIVSDGASGSTQWGGISGTLSNQTDLNNELTDINNRIDEIELFKFPNAVIIGTPTIQSGQISNFTTTSYLQFPFVVDVRSNSFEIDFCFTTGSDVTTQQNILDSKYGLALAISNGKGLMAMSSNGTNWDIGSTSGTMTISPNTTYYAKVTWDKSTYKTALSTDGATYTDDMTLSSDKGLYPTTIYIGGGSSTGLSRTPNPFKGSINFNKCYLYIAGLLVWQGMDDAGLATRADVSLSNLDSDGQAKFDEKMDADTKYGADLSYSNSSLQLKDQDGNALGNAVTIESSSYHPPILSCMWSDHLLNDIQWLRSDTFSWQSGDVYVTAYNKLVEEYNASTSTEETEGNITFRRSSNGFKIALASQESAILSKYNTDGIAWYYILDTANTRFKLPRTKFGFEGLRDNVGDDIAAGLPSIDHTHGYTNSNHAGYAASGSGSAYFMSWDQSTVQTSGVTGLSSIYGNSDTVQSPATQMYLYFYVGEYSQTAIEQTAGLNAELFNRKADIDTASIQAPYLKTSYVNGTSGYNIWSNGYCEQWGTTTATDLGLVITLSKTYKNTNYNGFAQHAVNTYSLDPGAGEKSVIPASTSTFTLYSGVRVGVSTRWIVCGYLAEGEY